MKQKIKLIVVICIILQSCSTKECVELEDNIIDPPIDEICDTGLLIMRSEGEEGAPKTFYLDSVSKPINTPLVFNNIRSDSQGEIFQTNTRPSNYDTYDAVNNVYFIEFPLQQRLYKYDINTQTRQEFTTDGFYAAPKFLNSSLYTISIDNNGYATNPANYSINTINQNDGTLTSLTTNSFALQSYFNWESMSSATNGSDAMYFLSGSNLISFNTNTTTAVHTELVPNFDFATDFQIFYGLERRNNGNLLAVRERDNDTGEGLELVEIDINNLTANPTVIFDFMSNEIEINSEFYSTTYDACDDTYYITTVDSNFITNFYEIDLSVSTYKAEDFSFYLMGIETKK